MQKTSSNFNVKSGRVRVKVITITIRLINPKINPNPNPFYKAIKSPRSLAPRCILNRPHPTCVPSRLVNII